MTEAEALQRYDAFLWKQVNAFSRLAHRPYHIQPLEDFIQEARLAFIQHIRTHDEPEWAACTLTIKGALYECARRQYPLTVSHNNFSKLLREKASFFSYEEDILPQGGLYEDDYTDIDLRTAITKLTTTEQAIVGMRLKGLTVKAIAEETGVTPQAISERLKSIRRKIMR